MKNKNILVVDDDPIIRQICETNLQSDGYEVQTAENGEDAIQSIKSMRPDLVVLDRMMPKLAGEALLDRIRKSELTKNLPVIFLTAKGTMQDIFEGLRLGANDYLVKPFSVTELVERVGNTLKRHSLINGDEDDWLARSDSVSARLEIVFNSPQDIPKVIYALSRDVVTNNIKGVKLGLYEALANAVYHGNLELDSSIKDEDGGFEKFEQMADSRVTDEKYKNRQVRVVFEMTSGYIKYTVSDDGDGFDWRKLSETVNDDPLVFAGRGIMLTKFYYHTVEWNEKGTEISMTYLLSPPAMEG